jgi:hypothetical protein
MGFLKLTPVRFLHSLHEMLNRITAVQVSDTRNDDSSNEACKIKMIIADLVKYCNKQLLLQNLLRYLL